VAQEVQTASTSSGRGTPVGRRVVLGMLGAGVAGVLYGSKAADLLERLVGPLTAHDRTGLLALFPVGRFRIYSVTSELPGRSAADYRLTVDGAVTSPLTLTLADLQAMPVTKMNKDFQCVTGWRVHDVKWTGVLLSEVLDRAGASANARSVQFRSFDGAYTESLTIEQARRKDVIVAYGMDGKTVSREHGGPVRLYVAPMYGYKSCKWLGGITVTEEAPKPGFWEVRGYDIDAWVGASNGRDDQPV
jgi:DMSO/TMAO reductase YedYZ molybdopterin-dependent catalytic subunit